MDGRLLAALSWQSGWGVGWQQVLDKTELKVDRQPFCLLIFWISVSVVGFFLLLFFVFLPASWEPQCGFLKLLSFVWVENKNKRQTIKP